MQSLIQVEPLERPVSASLIEETVSVVVPTRNAGPGFGALLEGIRKQHKVKNVEILVLDSGSTDDTVDLARQFGARVVLIDPAEFSHGGTRNRGGEEAAGDFIVFTVQDAVPLNPYWLFKLVSPMVADPELKAVSTRQVPPRNARIPLYPKWTLQDLELNIYSALGGRDVAIRAGAKLRDGDIPPEQRRVSSFFDNVCSCIRKDYFLDNRFSVIVNAEDMDYGYRLLKSGEKFGFIQSTGVIHYHDRGPEHILKVNYLGVLAQHDILGVEPPFYFRLNGIRLADLARFFSSYLVGLSHVLKDLDQGEEWLQSYCKLVMQVSCNGHGSSMAPLTGPLVEDLSALRTAVDSWLPHGGEEPETDRQDTLWLSLLPFHQAQLNWLENSVDAPKEEIGRALLCLAARFFGHHIAGYYLSHRDKEPDLCNELNESLELGICRGVRLGAQGEPAPPIEPEVLSQEDQEALHELPMDGERFLPWMGDPRISYEHLHRYHFAGKFAGGKRLLDLGCGEGYGANLLAEVARSVTAIDIDPDAVAHAGARYRRDNLEYLQEDARAGSVLEDRSFDMVVCFEVLEHVEEQDAFIETIARVLKEDGLAILSTPNKSVSKHGNAFHVRELTFEEFQSLIGRHFPHSRFYSQQDLAGSAIIPLEGGGSLEMSNLVRETGGYRISDEKRSDHEYFIALVSHQPTTIEHAATRNLCLDYSRNLDDYYMDQIHTLREGLEEASAEFQETRAELATTIDEQQLSLLENETRALRYAHETSTLETHMDDALLLALKTHEMVSQMVGYWNKVLKSKKRSKGHMLSPEDLVGMKKVFEKLDISFHRISTLLNPKQKPVADTE